MKTVKKKKEKSYIPNPIRKNVGGLKNTILGFSRQTHLKIRVNKLYMGAVRNQVNKNSMKKTLKASEMFLN